MPELGEDLSQREIDVLKCVADGSSNKEVALHLSISPYTVKTHLRNIYTKLGTNSRTEAIRVGMEQGVLVLPGQPANGEATSEVALNATSIEAVPDVPVSVSDVAVAMAVSAPASQKEPSLTRTGSWQIWAFVGFVLLLIVGVYFWQFRPQEPVVEEPLLFSIQAIDNSWFEVDAPLTPLAHMASSEVGFVLYQIGGRDVDGVQNDVLAIDTLEKSVTAVSSKPTAVSHASAAQLFSEIYVVGGVNDAGVPTDVVEVYSPTADAWLQLESLPEPLSGVLAIADLDTLYVFGGHDGETAVASFYRYNLASDEWEVMPPMPMPRAFASGAVIEGDLYVIGGENESGALSSCTKFNLNLNQWDSCASMRNPRSHAKAVTIFGKLYLFGGKITNGDEQLIAEVYVPGNNNWEPIVAPPELATWSNWEGLGVSLAGQDIYVMGGMVNGRLSSENYIYTPLSNRLYLPSTATDK